MTPSWRSFSCPFDDSSDPLAFRKVATNEVLSGRVLVFPETGGGGIEDAEDLAALNQADRSREYILVLKDL